jgi:hypothetical protein
MGRGPIEPTFGDAIGQAFNQRIGDVQNRIAQVGEMFTDPAKALQQRMLGEQRQVAQDQAADTEVKSQTIKTYGDGSQERVEKTQVPAGQPQAQGGARLTTPIAGMPQNLPATGPISPEDAQRQIQMAQMPQPGASVQVAGATQMPPQAQPRPQLQAQPAMGQMPPANYGMATGQAPTGIRMPQAQPPAAVAAAPGASLAQQGQVAQAQPVAGTPYTPTAEREVPQPAAWVQSANDAGTDLNKLFDVAARHPESRAMIQGKMELALKNKTKEDEANDLFKAAAAGDLKAQNKIFQQIKPETGKAREEITTGDYVKAILFKRLGLDALASDVENKIRGKDTKFGQISFGGSNWETETDSTGRIVRAKDDQGTIATEATLNKLRAGGEKFGAQSTAFTGGIHTVPNAAGTGQDLLMPTQNAITGKAGFTYASGPKQGQAYTGNATPQPQSIGTSYSKALNDAFIKYQTAPTTEMAKKMMEIAGQVDDGSGKTINSVMDRIRTQTPQIFGQITGGQAGTPPAPTGVGGGTGTASPATPIDANAVARVDRSIAEIDREIARATQSTAVDPARKAQQLQVLNDERNRLLTARQTMTPAGVPVATAQAAPAAPASGGGSLLAQQTQQKETAQEVGTDIGKIKVNQTKSEQNADYLLTKINDLVTHPGFSVSVGATVQPGFQYIPGTDRASWADRFKEIKGQAFLQAIQDLRGLGALSNDEGKAATEAIQRMGTGSSEKEFKAAAADFQTIIQRGIDRNREKLGQPPLYGTPAASELAKQPEAAKPAKLSSQDKQAVEWARQNPNDPRAAETKKRLGLGS